MKIKLFCQICWAILRDAAWAPALTLLIRAGLLALGVRPLYDPHIHFLGGFTIAYFYYRAVRIASPLLGPLTPSSRTLLAFTCACTTALFWEFAELASDRLTGGHIQHNVFETLNDLLYGTGGAFICLVSIRLIFVFQKRSFT